MYRRKKMGKKTERDPKSRTLPPSPSHSFSSSSSSDFEFTISVSPRKSSTTLCPADELFYKGQLLPLHLSPRISMVRTLILASSSTSSSSDTNTTASRDSTGSSNDSHSSFNSDIVLLSVADGCDSSRPSSTAEDDEFRRLNNTYHCLNPLQNQIKKNKYFSLSRFSSVFRKETKINRETAETTISGSHVKRISSNAKEVVRKYLKKVKPLYEKLSQKNQPQKMVVKCAGSLLSRTDRSAKEAELSGKNTMKESRSRFSQSFSGNLRYPRRKSCASSCPSSMRSSPSHSGVLYGSGFPSMGLSRAGSGSYCADMSSMEELQNAIQGAIAHCKNSMNQSKSTTITTIGGNEI